MALAKQIPPRSQVEKAYTWALEDLYPDQDAWEAELLQAQKVAKQATGYQGKLRGSAAELLAFCQLEEQLGELLRRLYGYAYHWYDQDTTNAQSQALEARSSSVTAECESAVAFAGPEIIAIPAGDLDRFYAEQPALERYRRSLTERRRRKAHVLSEAEETLLAAAKEMAAAPETIYSRLENADLTFPPATDSQGEKHQLTHGSYIPLMKSSDRALRKSTFENFYHTYAKVRNTSAALLAGQINQLKFFAKAHKYSSTLEAALDVTNVPVEVYHNLIQAVHEDLPYLHKYIALRKKLLGVDELHMYDLYTPIVPDAEIAVSYEQAKKNVFEAVAPLGREYQSILQKGFDSRWIDVYENEGKRSGAYSAGHREHPFVLMNYKDTLDCEFTLAHEMGHALHSYYSNQAQTPVDSEYVIFVAEVASTCNENLLMQYLLQNTSDKKVRAYLINYFLEQFRATIYRQVMFAEFELQINQASERGEALTSEMLNKLYHDLNALYYGPGLVIDGEIDFEWARIPHFYMNFYVFQYATGFAAAIALSERILKEGGPAVQDYLSFLRGGCSKDPISLLQGAGVDMRTPGPVHQALRLFNTLIDEMEQLLAE